MPISSADDYGQWDSMFINEDTSFDSIFSPCLSDSDQHLPFREVICSYYHRHSAIPKLFISDHHIQQGPSSRENERLLVLSRKQSICEQSLVLKIVLSEVLSTEYQYEEHTEFKQTLFADQEEAFLLKAYVCISFWSLVLSV